MSEYWVSHKKYFCKYCNIYIADDKPSRTQHETGLKHKGNVERFVRGLYKAGEKRKQDLEEEKREMARVEKAAAAAYAQDVSAGLVKPGSSGAPVPSSKQAGSSKPSGKAADPYSNYSTAASLGYTDPDAERREAEAAARRSQGVVGAWEVVAVEESVPESGEDAVGETAGTEDVPSRTDESTRKREAEAPPDDDDTRQFKLRRKTLGAGLGEIYDPGLIPIKLKAKKEEPAEVSLKTEGSSTVVPATSSVTTSVPKWSSRGWSKPGEAKQPDVPSASDAHPATADVTPEAEHTKVTSSDAQQPSEPPEPVAVKTEVRDIQREPEAKQEEPATAGSLFRKRKAPVGGAGSRGRRS